MSTSDRMLRHLRIHAHNDVRMGLSAACSGITAAYGGHAAVADIGNQIFVVSADLCPNDILIQLQ